MNYSKIILLFLSLFIINNNLFAQKKRKIKPVFYGKIQGGFLYDNFIGKAKTSFNYINLGIRKKTGKKVREIGLESFYYSQKHDVVYNPSDPNFPISGTLEEGFVANSYWYLGLKHWQFSKLKIGLGPQFSLGYHHKSIIPLTTSTFLQRFNDFKIGASGRIEISYPLSQRFSIIASTQYTIFQFGVRRIYWGNPTIVQSRQLKDFVQVDFLVNRYVVQLGIIAQFGKIKKDRVKIKKKRDKKRQKKKDQLQKQKAKKQKKKDKKNKSSKKR